MINEGILIQSMISDRMWKLKDLDPERFKQEVKEHFARGYPNYSVVRAKYPFIYLRNDRP